AAFVPKIQRPILILQGPHGAGKTFLAKILRSLIDPCTSPINPVPTSVRELRTIARSNSVLAFNRVAALRPQISEALDRLATADRHRPSPTRSAPPSPPAACRGLSFARRFRGPRPPRLAPRNRW